MQREHSQNSGHALRHHGKYAPSFFILCAFMILASSLAISAGTRGIRITLNNSGLSDTAYFGINLAATACVDAALGEDEAPPSPPAGVIYTAFVDKPCLGNGLKLDIHQGFNVPSTIDTFRMKLQLADENLLSASIVWPNTVLAKYAHSASLFAGGTTVNMLTDSVFTWDPTGTDISNARLIIDWKSMSDTGDVSDGDTGLAGVRLMLTNGGVSDTAFFGIAANATKCIDPVLGEDEAPPFPPTGVMSVAFTELPCLGNGIRFDLHPIASADTFRFKLQLADESANSASITWNMPRLAMYANAATMSGDGINVDMLANSSFTWDPNVHVISSVKIQVSWKTSEDSVHYPQITSFSPDSGEVGTSVTINGMNFGASQGGSVVLFGSTSANVSSWSDNQVVAAVPAGIHGTVKVAVNIKGNMGVASSLFRVLAGPPAIHGIRLTLSNDNQIDTTFMGTYPSATFCIDPALGEDEAPPFPPAGVMSSAFTENPCLGQGLKYDLHPVVARDTFRLKIQLGDDNALTASIHWSAATLAMYASSARMNSGSMTVNMLTDSVFAWNPSDVAISNVKIYVSWSDAIDTVKHAMIGSFSPKTGPVGTSVTIQGENFGTTQGTSSVAFGGTTVTPTAWYDTLIVATVPQGSSGSVSVSVTVNGDMATAADVFVVSLPPPPPGPPGIRLTFMNGGQTDTAFFGIHPQATKCIDPELGENELPPFPPTGVLWSAFTDLPCLGNGLKADLHPGYPVPSTPDTFKLKLQVADESVTSASLSWPNGLLSRFANSASMVAAGMPSVNMLTDSVLIWDPSNTVLGSVRIFVDWKGLPDTNQHFDSSLAVLKLTITNFDQVDTATFGYHPMATACIDAALGEEEVPPFPPSGVLFAAFTEKPCLGNGLTWDLHSVPPHIAFSDTFRLKVQIADPSLHEVKVAWSLAGVARMHMLGNLSVTMTGATHSVNMLTDSVFYWDPTIDDISSLRIIVSNVIAGVGPAPLATPSVYALGQNYPNPFNPTTVITYQLPQQASVHLSVFNVLGQEVRVLAHGIQDAGEKSVTFDATGLTSGIYIYRLEATSTTDPMFRINESKKLMLLK